MELSFSCRATMSSIFRLCLIALLLTNALARCPSRCKCTDESINCVNQKLEAVPNFANLNTTAPLIMDLSGNDIKLIIVGDFSFDNVENIKEIYLNRSKVVMFEPNSLDELVSLQELYLADNSLSDLAENLFVKNKELLLMDLSENQFTYFPKINSHSLEVLSLRKNRIETMEANALKHMPNLRVLQLQDNNLKNLHPHTFSVAKNLIKLRLEFNPLECNCQTVKLFNHLLGEDLLDLEVPIQCFSEDKTLIDIFNGSQLTEPFKKACLEGKLEVGTFLMNKSLETKRQANKTATVNHRIDEEDQYEVGYVYFLMLTLALWMGFVVGAVFGGYITYSRMKGLNASASKKLSLLCEN